MRGSISVFIFIVIEVIKADPSLTNIVFIGATGDLASKYLWKSLFNVFLEQYDKADNHFWIYGCARMSPDKGRGELSRILLGLNCTDKKCEKLKPKFVESVQYSQLKTEENYKTLARKINENSLSYYGLSNQAKTFEVGRMIYLAIPPSAYAETSKFSNLYLRPQHRRSWFRMVFEKPFGSDLTTAENLLQSLGNYFTDDEVYFIDHYLGKSISKMIFPFRFLNRNTYESLWNKDHIERIEIVMKEEIGVKGRFPFYNPVGVVRDVMQNHLMEMLMLVTMAMPSNSGNISEILEMKANILSSFYPVQHDHILFAQYSSYIDEAKKELKNLKSTTKTPTFAAALIKSFNPHWNNVPFVLVSGKRLNEKFSYIRVIFKQNRFCLEKDASCRENQHIIFNIANNNELKPPMVLISKSLPKPVIASTWKISEGVNTNVQYFGQSVKDMYQIVPTENEDAYTTLMKAILNGEKHMFTSPLNILNSWKIWMPVLVKNDLNLRLYNFELGENKILPNELDFTVNADSIAFVDEIIVHHSEDRTTENVKYSHKRSKYLDDLLVTGTIRQISQQLCDDILHSAILSIHEVGEFHLALSGGKSPLPVLEILRNMEIPWHSTHIWMVDERCVDSTDKFSNSKFIADNLLNYINLPHDNFHPMPVRLFSDLCIEEDRGATLYENTLKRLLQNSSLDFLLLGVGNDGHTASLFPHDISETLNDDLVTVSHSIPSDTDSKRMTLTLSMLNKSKQVAVFVTGSQKHDILHKLELAKTPTIEYPITLVKPLSGMKVWYIDHSAL